MRLRLSPQSNPGSTPPHNPVSARFNEAAAFAAEQRHYVEAEDLRVDTHASMRLRLSPQSNQRKGSGDVTERSASMRLRLSPQSNLPWTIRHVGRRSARLQ